MNATAMKWLERVIIALSALALLMTFVSLPNTASSGWGWFLLATTLFALGFVAGAALIPRRGGRTHEGSFLFSHIDASSLWLVARIYLGSVWLQAGLQKLFDPGWTLELKGFWAWAAYTPPGPHPQVAFSWYRDLLQSMLVHHTYTWFAWVITLSELTVGILLILGLFTGLAAFAGGSLNLLYLFAGSAGINPVMLLISLFLLMAWKVAGYYGLDRILLPFVTKRLHHQTGKKVSRMRGPGVVLQPPAPALSIDEAHGFE